jgi:2-polyprenyl-3-methyl-5-hydroxy-6-metoxy-1,4-benzoquinol methylase
VPIPTYYGNEICYVNGMKYARDVVKSVVRYRRTVQSVKRYPEFQEFWVHYPVKQSPYSSHDYVRRFAGSGERILDIGCGEGFLSSELAEKGNQVTGMDQLAQPKCVEQMQAYFQCDLSAGIDAVIEQLQGQTFDKIMLMDVLEHLPRPESILQSCHAVMAPQGQILVSVPNVANVTVRLMLLLGRFNYAERGILDRTHLRFFTRKTARRLLEDNGYQVVKELTTNVPLELILGIGPDNPVIRFLHHLLHIGTRLFRNLLGYQCMFVARQRPRL